MAKVTLYLVFCLSDVVVVLCCFKLLQWTTYNHVFDLVMYNVGVHTVVIQFTIQSGRLLFL